ncbi:hypothetical protein OTSTA716_2372 [Orientia tsutsugamushi str. TA716]|uniref:Uncharacterized protein n=2 Tax=Orientia tsutsugamushi TaxID=784 RepID=A0A0F3NTM6_ORITS|nr:hypothetical protein OTSTA716_2372 [Orientia tsutsugamushi str. TA716]
MKMRKFWLAIALSLPCSLPAVAYDLSDLKKLEELEKLERLQHLQQLKQEEKIASYYFRLYGGYSSCVQEELDLSASVGASERSILREISNLANQYANSSTFMVSLGMYCTRSLMLELSLGYMQNMIFGCDMDINTTRGLVKLKNVPIGAFAKAIANLTGFSIPSVSAECKLCWDMCSGSFGSIFITGGICIQSIILGVGTTTLNNKVIFLPGSTIGAGFAINVTQDTSLTISINGTYLHSSHLLSNENVKIEGLYGYNLLLGVKHNF